MNQLTKLSKEALSAQIDKTSEEQRKFGKPKDTKSNEEWASKVFHTFKDCYTFSGRNEISSLPNRFGFWLANGAALMEDSATTLLYALTRCGLITKAELDAAFKGMKEGFKLNPCPHTKKKRPCTTEDALIIVNAMPKDWVHRIETAAAVLLSSECGARTISIVNVRKHDIVYIKEDNIVVGCKVTFRFGKGHRCWDHTIKVSLTH